MPLTVQGQQKSISSSDVDDQMTVRHREHAETLLRVATTTTWLPASVGDDVSAATNTSTRCCFGKPVYMPSRRTYHRELPTQDCQTCTACNSGAKTSPFLGHHTLEMP
ncbi:hypothetical protein AB0C24_23640 [Amycolatopsis japonica]|uniref:hypothetical protein n=1 Tax=Amycolatopsis japonica TaxID=208439 RepID=UPI0033F0E320